MLPIISRETLSEIVSKFEEENKYWADEFDKIYETDPKFAAFTVNYLKMLQNKFDSPTQAGLMAFVMTYKAIEKELIKTTLGN